MRVDKGFDWILCICNVWERNIKYSFSKNLEQIFLKIEPHYYKCAHQSTTSTVNILPI